ARQALSAAGPGDDAELHFGLAELRSWGRYTIVSGHRELQASSERTSVNRCNRGLAVFDLQQQREQAGSARSFSGSDLAEFLYVGAGDESTSAANQHCGFYGIVLADLLDRIGDPSRNIRAQGVHWRIVDGKDRDLVISRKFN